MPKQLEKEGAFELTPKLPTCWGRPVSTTEMNAGSGDKSEGAEGKVAEWEGKGTSLERPARHSHTF